MGFVAPFLVAVLASAAYFYVFLHTPDTASHLSAVQLASAYDFIVVGSGSAGAVVAARLAENENVTVLLVEAGGSDVDLKIQAPAAAPLLQRTSYDFTFKTTPQKHSHFAMIDNRSNWPRGKVLGGSSSLNYMAYVRGHKGDYDEWEAMGAAGWGWEDVLPYFKKSEDNHQASEPVSDEHHGKGGFLEVTDLVDRNEATKLFVKAGLELGYPLVDFNSGEQEGVNFCPRTVTRANQRCSTTHCLIRPLLREGKRKNLSVVTMAHATKINFDTSGARPRAESVTLARLETAMFETIKANKEIIVAGGTVGSAQLLMVSGVGHAEHLQSLGIPVVADLPVGDNLQDHLIVLVKYLSPSLTTLGPKTDNLYNALSYLIRRRGPLTSNGVEACLFTETGARPDLKRPDVQLQLVPTPGTPVDVLNFNFKPEYADIMLQGDEGFTTAVTLLHPKSVGTIRLRSANPLDHPIIDPNYLSAPEDLETLVRGVKLSVELSKTAALKDVATSTLAKYKDVFQTLMQKPLDEDEELYREYVKFISATVYHPVGTCKMGAAEDPTSVVLPDLRVKGVDGLRVADGSVMPNVVGGNTNAPIIMIGEKAADMIKKSHGL